MATLQHTMRTSPTSAFPLARPEIGPGRCFSSGQEGTRTSCPLAAAGSVRPGVRKAVTEPAHHPRTAAVSLLQERQRELGRVPEEDKENKGLEEPLQVKHSLDRTVQPARVWQSRRSVESSLAGKGRACVSRHTRGGVRHPHLRAAALTHNQE